ncbi:MAG TPA: DUF1707 domain-containing protein [Solirubrobacteraceae bacterium]
MPPDAPTPAGGRPASDADRDRLAAALGQQYAAGRLDLQELDLRLEQVLGAASLSEAAAALQGLDPLDDRAPRRRGWRGRHGERDRPQPGWAPTLERFRDPGSNRLMRVWVDPVDGTRHYVAEG